MNTFDKLLIRVLVPMLRPWPALAERLADCALRARYGMPVSPAHYHSPLPDVSSLARDPGAWRRPGTLEGIALDPDSQKAFLEKLLPYRSECASLPSLEEIAARGYGPGYGEVEARLLYCVLRFLKPRRIIEVGSGASTFYHLAALEANGDEGRDGELTCIEPDPNSALLELAEHPRITLHRSEVQDFEPAFFRTLGEDDVLFVDSSHVSKVASDVNWLCLEILPRLNPGVVVHFHDVPLPYLTVPPGHPMFRASLLWNEPALVKAFLLYNAAFEILSCQSYVHFEFPESIGRLVDAYDPDVHFPDSLWLRRKG